MRKQFRGTLLSFFLVIVALFIVICGTTAKGDGLIVPWPGHPPSGPVPIMVYPQIEYHNVSTGNYFPYEFVGTFK